jgi:YVTN family beta-propeller protein
LLLADWLRKPACEFKKENVIMKNLTQKLSKHFLGVSVRVVTLALFLMVFGASAALAQTRGYVTNSIDNTVSVIDPATNTVVGTPISVGTGPRGVAVTPNGAFAYVANFGSNDVSVISAATNTVVATVPVGLGPNDIAITPNGAFAYVTNSVGNSVSVINTATDMVTATIPLTAPQRIAITPSGRFAWVTNNSSNIEVIDTAANVVSDTVPLGSSSNGGIAFTPNGAFAYAVLPFSVKVIDRATNVVVATINTGTGADSVAITPNGAFAYVSMIGVSRVSPINTATNTVVTNISVGNNPRRLAVDPTGTSVYVPQSSSSGTVTVISTATNMVTGTIATGAGSTAIAFAVPTQGPTNKDQCKDGGWATFTNPEFKNQGQCIKFVNHMDEHEH